MAEQVTCPDCGHENAPDQRFCGSCGASLAVACPACGEGNPPTFAFCGSCGGALHAAARPGPVEEERKVVSVVFADLVGFTSRAERLDPEDVRAILTPYYERLRGELESFGGTVEKFIGDAVVALFGAPIARGDDPERAVRAALAVRDAIAEMNDADPELDLHVRIAVNTGEAIVAVGERADEKLGMAAGDVINTAARLQVAAPVDGVLVGEETYRSTRDAFRYEEAEPVEAKGKERPVPAWIAVEPVSGPAERPRRGAPLIGRDYELDALRGIWRRAVGERRPHLVTVMGPPGIGKTRLADEFAHLVGADGGRAIRGRSLPYSQTGAYAPFAQQVKQIAEIYDTDPIPVAREKLERIVADLIDEGADEVASHVAMLVGLAAAGAEIERQVAFFSVRRLVEALARRTPTMLVFEDVHWADPNVLDLVELLASRLRDAPLLLLTLARPELLETRPSWGGGLPSYTALPLDPLRADASRTLASHLLGGDPVPDAAERLVATAEGNPLFLEELAASLRERETAALSELPTTVRGIIAARLDVLPPPERRALLDAAVIGKVFWRGALARISDDDAALPEILDSLERRDLVFREPASRIAGDEQFSFKHMLIREVAYATLPRARRRERHAAVARFFEDAAGERIGEYAAILADHWRDAGEPERELHYLLVAAERGWAHEAVELYERALALVADDDARRKREILLAAAIARVHTGDFKTAAERLDDLLPELEGRGRLEALVARARAAFWLADAAGTRQFGAEAHAQAEQLGDDELEVLALAILGVVDGMEGAPSEGVKRLETAIAGWKPGGHRRQFAEAHMQAGLQSYWLGRYERGLEFSRLAQRLGDEESHIEAMISARAHAGMALAGLGRHEEAFAAFEQGFAIGIELELQPRFTGRLANMWAGALREVHELDEARRLNERAIELGEQAAFPGAQVSGKIDLLVIDLLLGDVGRAETAWPHLWEAAVATKGWHQWLWVARLQHARAETALAAGRLDQALEGAHEAVAFAERYHRLKYVAASRLVLGRVLLELGRYDDAARVLERALREAEGLKHPPSIWQAAAELARAYAATGRDGRAEDAAAKSETALRAFADGLSDERRTRFLEAPRVAAVVHARGAL